MVRIEKMMSRLKTILNRIAISKFNKSKNRIKIKAEGSQDRPKMGSNKNLITSKVKKQTKANNFSKPKNLIMAENKMTKARSQEMRQLKKVI